MKHFFYSAIVILLMTATAKAQNQDPWTEYMTPSSVHTLLKQYEGSFKMDISMYMGDGKEPTIITVNSKHIMLLGGRFLELKQQGNMMGMDYESIITLGFNNIDKKFALTTITTMGTATLSLSGNWNDKSKSAILFGTLTNPVSKNNITIKQVVTFVDNDTILIESYDKEGDNLEKKTVQYKLSRIK